MVSGKDGHTLTPDDLAKLDDPIAKFILNFALEHAPAEGETIARERAIAVLEARLGP